MPEIKTKLSVCVVVLASLVSLGASAQTPQSYPLVCKGGGSFTLNFPPVQYAYPGFEGTVVGIGFLKSSRAATAGVQPGTCAWLDRGLNANEPTSLVAKFPNAFVYVSASHADGRVTPVYRYAGDKDQLQNFVEALRAGREIQVYAYNDGHDLVVTRFGP